MAVHKPHNEEDNDGDLTPKEEEEESTPPKKTTPRKVKSD